MVRIRQMERLKNDSQVLLGVLCAVIEDCEDFDVDFDELLDRATDFSQ